MKISVLVASFVLFFLPVMAQNAGKISGSILQSREPAQGVTIGLLRAKDSATVKLSVVNKEGLYVFENIVDGKYLIGVTAVAHQKSFSDVFEVNSSSQTIQVAAIILTGEVKTLTGVTVTAKRPLIENKIDRTIVNVDASVMNVGTSALEVLEKSPGVSVDKDGNISLKGKQGVLVMVDGRPTHLNGADLANLLRNMSSGQLDQIEIMTNPPARYDAAGTSGIINIKTKKTITIGFNGSGSITYSQGKYPKTAEAFNFNYREGKVNMFTNLSHNYQRRYSILKIDRNILNSSGNAIDKVFNQEANRFSTGNSYNASVGVDFFATKKTTLGAVVNLNSRLMSSNNPGSTNISNAANDLESVTTALVNNEAHWNSLSTNLNFRTLLDTKGKELTSDIDFVKHSSDNDLFMVNSYTDAVGNPDRKADTLMGVLPQNIKVYTARVDYLQPLKKGAKFEAGIKTGVVRTDNNASYDSVQYGRTIHDFNRSNYFDYEENINAAYANLSTPLSKKITVQFGLRLENTNATGRQRTTGEKFDRHYTQLFPTAFFQYVVNDKNNFVANLGRRVHRPSYQSLNPFIKFLDRYTYSQGNPALKPSVSTNFEISHTWKKQITTTVNYTNEKDIIHEVIQQKGQEAYNMPANVSSLKQFGISVSANTPINKWWTSNIYINAYNDHYKGLVNSTPVELTATSIVFNGTQQFKINKSLTAELSGRYRNGWLEGLLRVKPVGFIGAGLSQKVLKNQGTLRLTARDIFHTQKLTGTSQYSNVDFEMRQVSETQIVSIGFSYTFSKGKKMAPVKRTSGSANEEKDRIGQ